jgi:hypothetical protein
MNLMICGLIILSPMNQIRPRLCGCINQVTHFFSNFIVAIGLQITPYDSHIIYPRGTNGVLMQCITREEGCELLTEVHGGECENHASSCTLVGKAFRHGFYWHMTLQDAIELEKTCRACQFHGKQIYTPVQMLQMILPS